MNNIRMYITILVVMMLIFCVIPLLDLNTNDNVVKAADIFVDLKGHGDHTTIQAAIAAANPGDTIYVWAGMYNESVVIDKTVTVIGNGTGNTTINGTGIGDTVRVTEDFVNISGFTIKNSGLSYYGLT